MLEIKPKILETKTWKDISDPIGKNDKFGWKYNSFSSEKGYVSYQLSVDREIILNGDTGYYITISLNYIDKVRFWKRGCYWNCLHIFNLQDITNFFNYLMTEKLLSSKIPYLDVGDDFDGESNNNIASPCDFRGIPVDNFKVIVSDFLVGILKGFGFDFGGWYKEYNSIPENSIEDWKIPKKYKHFMEIILERD